MTEHSNDQAPVALGDWCDLGYRQGSGPRPRARWLQTSSCMAVTAARGAANGQGDRGQRWAGPVSLRRTWADAEAVTALAEEAGEGRGADQQRRHLLVRSHGGPGHRGPSITCSTAMCARPTNSLPRWHRGWPGAVTAASSAWTAWPGRVGLAGGAAYGATKAALTAMTRAWAAEFSPSGVRGEHRRARTRLHCRVQAGPDRESGRHHPCSIVARNPRRSLRSSHSSPPTKASYITGAVISRRWRPDSGVRDGQAPMSPAPVIGCAKQVALYEATDGRERLRSGGPGRWSS